MPKDHRSARALAAAEGLYKRKPDAATEEFRKVCERADKGRIGKLSNREFIASYVLPLRRSKALKGRSSRKRKKTARRAVKQSRQITVMKARLTASTSIHDLLLDLGIADEAAHDEATKVARKIADKVLDISNAG